ncbi:uncharacterized protein LOC125855991 [Solanum stenotomum]|uniref:uncharacterized protein LOC125855991 n=1 Tax=Solanum stenotomum TaxID=172797 RepID=UPI0020D14145|nr:uncharacterized protein LOC125855991 [Solanum stenotomum]
MADRNVKRRIGVLQDVPMKVESFIFLADFVILDSEVDFKESDLKSVSLVNHIVERGSEVSIEERWGVDALAAISIAPEDKEKTTFTYPYGTFAFKRIPFGLCNASSTFRRCMMWIFSDMVQNTIEVLMDDFSMVGDSFDGCMMYLPRY